MRLGKGSKPVRSDEGGGRSMPTFHVDPVCIDIHVEVLVQVSLRGTLANLFDLQETSTPCPRSMFGLSGGFPR